MVAPVPIEPAHVRWSGPDPRLDRPTLIAAFEGWNDAGDAATTAASHLAGRWGCEPVADIDPEPFFDFTAARPMVLLDDSKARQITWPANEVRGARLADPGIDAVVLIGTEPQLRWRTFTEQLIALAGALGVGRVVTLGALLAEVPHSRDVEVYGSTDDEQLRAELGLTPSTYEGPTGIVGVLSSACLRCRLSHCVVLVCGAVVHAGRTIPQGCVGAGQPGLRPDGGSGIPTFDLEQRAQTYEREITRIVAEDDETAEYVARLEKAWDAGQQDEDDSTLSDDPDLLVAEVEKFLREGG